MEFYIDSADVKQIKEISSLGIFHGVTTTPTFFMKEGARSYQREIKKMLKCVDGPVHLEAMGEACEEIVASAKANAKISKRIVSKIPMGREAVKAVKILSGQGIKTNVHLIFSVSQAVMAAEAGADYLCPLIGRLNDIEGNGIALLEKIVAVYRQHNYTTRVMASSIRNQEHITQALLCGVDAVTIPPRVIDCMFDHPLTSLGINQFKKDTVLSASIESVMRPAAKIPLLTEKKTLLDALTAMSLKKIGICVVKDRNKSLKGIVTDGDVRRILQKNQKNIGISLDRVMNKSPKSGTRDMPIQAALKFMEEQRITALVVVDDTQQPVGLCNLHDILQMLPE